MHAPIAVTGIAALWVLVGCGGPSTDPQSTEAPAAASEASAPPIAGGFDRDVSVTPEISAAWRAVRVTITDRETGDTGTYDVPLGGAELLGDSGLVLSALTFVPDFVMDEDGIRSRSSAAANPAVRVVISEDGVEDFEGWLFAAMPETLPFQHERYEVLLVEGITAE